MHTTIWINVENMLSHQSHIIWFHEYEMPRIGDYIETESG